MYTARNICSIHQVIEILPGVWKRDRAVRRAQRRTKPGREAACPTCFQMAQAVFQQQFPALYTSATPRTRKSA